MFGSQTQVRQESLRTNRPRDWSLFLACLLSPMPTKTPPYAAQTAKTPLAPFSTDRRHPLPNDVQMEIFFCGVCHSDLHFARGEWAFSTFPAIPGHEIVGKVTKVGSAVKSFKAGDLAAVGCMVD